MSSFQLTDLLDNLEVFWTELSPARAVVYARLADSECQSGWRLSGNVRGPRSTRSQTLPATIPFMDLGPGPTHLARAVVPDPSYWSPDSPNIYDVQVELNRPGLPTLSDERQLGFRPIRAGERYLLREGKPWVPRGIASARGIQNLTVSAARAEGLVVALPDADWSQASSEGLYTTAEVGGSVEQITRSLRELSRWPAIFMALVTHTVEAADAIRKEGHNLLLAQAWRVGDEQEVRPWADALVLRTQEWQGSDRLPSLNRPVFFVESIARPLDVRGIRRECDALQLKLAPNGQFAGYFVSSNPS